jgi:CubicO group peptidase (beta-lactamase class C family)
MFISFKTVHTRRAKRKIMKLIKMFLLITLFFSFFLELEGQNISEKTNLSATLDEYLRRATANGFYGAVLAAKDGKIILRKGYGWADRENKIPITAETIFDIGSHVKAFTATAIMQLEEQGKLSASDAITKYFQGVPADKTQITIHHLLTHTSGIDFDYFYDEKKTDEREILRDKDKYIQKVLSFPPGYETGKTRRYSNTGFQSAGGDYRKSFRSAI